MTPSTIQSSQALEYTQNVLESELARTSREVFLKFLEYRFELQRLGLEDRVITSADQIFSTKGRRLCAELINLNLEYSRLERELELCNRCFQRR